MARSSHRLLKPFLALCQQDETEDDGNDEFLTSSLMRASSSSRAFFTDSSRPTMVMISRSFELFASESVGKRIRAPVNSRILRMLAPLRPIKNLRTAKPIFLINYQTMGLHCWDDGNVVPSLFICLLMHLIFFFFNLIFTGGVSGRSG